MLIIAGEREDAATGGDSALTADAALCHVDENRMT